MTTSNPTSRAHNDLDQLKRRAKELLKAFCAGDAEALALVRAHYRDADPAVFALHDAQLVLARSLGFESWPKLKAYVDGVTITRFCDAAQAGKLATVRAMLRQRPELVHMDRAHNNEHRALHYAVLNRDAAMTRLLMEAGSDARKGIYPHRDATTAWQIAHDRVYDDIVAIIEEEEQHRREGMSCPNATVSPVQDQINDAIRRGDDARAIALLEAEPSLIKACDREGRTPLHVAAAAANVRIVRWLCGRRADVKRLDAAGQTPGDAAVRGVGWRERHKAPAARQVLELLQSRGAPATPLVAAAMGDLEAIDRLADELRGGELTNVYGGGPLSATVTFGQPAALSRLLGLGLDPDERTQLHDLEEPTFSWGGPLWRAAAFGEHEMATMLLDAGADPNGQVYASGDPIGNAWATRDDAMKTLLLARGARVSAAMIGYNSDEEAARAALEGRLHVRVENPEDDLVTELVKTATSGGSEAIVKMCLDRLDWPAGDPRWDKLPVVSALGIWALGPHRTHTAHVDRGAYPRMLRMFLERGADPNQRGRWGESLLHRCATCGVIWGRDLLTPAEYVERAKILLDAGARLDVRDDLLKSTPLGWACRWGRVEMVKLLLERGADAVEAEAEPWATPLAWAMKMGHEEIVELLDVKNGWKR